MKNLTAIFLVIILYSLNVYSDEYAEKLDKLVNEYNDIGMFSGVVLLAKDGKPLYEKTFGYADWEKKTPVSEETLFRIGSLNKMFTHAIMIQLLNEGKLKLTDPLNMYLNIYSGETGSKITLQMLLEMKAGLGDYLNNPEFFRNNDKFKTVDDFIEIIKNEPLLFEPGTDQRYSNSGYVVLGSVIEKVTDKSYPDNVKERFLIPLGMNNTYYRQVGEPIPNAATGTLITYSGIKENTKFEEQPSPAGGMYSTANDLLKFDNELRRTGLIPAGIRAGGTDVWNSIFAQLEDGYTVIITSNFGQVGDEIIGRYVKMIKNEPYPKPDVTMNMKLYSFFKNGGTDELEKNLKQTIEANDMEYNDMHLNFFGYQLMQSGELDYAIDVFKLNVKLFPYVSNVWDSMGEAYMNAGNKELARVNYKKALEMNPGNENARKMLEKLGEK